jgi:hypothetical protein
MMNINNLQLKPSISRELKQNTCLAQVPVSMCNTTKHVIEILDAKYDNQIFQALSRIIVLT